MGGIQAKVFASRYLDRPAGSRYIARRIQETKQAFEARAVCGDE